MTMAFIGVVVLWVGFGLGFSVWFRAILIIDLLNVACDAADVAVAGGVRGANGLFDVHTRDYFIVRGAHGLDWRRCGGRRHQRENIKVYLFMYANM